MPVRIRLKRMGRTHRPFYRLCAIDGRKPRDGRVLEELGHYDPMVRETDARANLKGERIDYWLGVGAQPSDRVKVLIRKYGSNGTHLEAQRVALSKTNIRPVAPPPVAIAMPEEEEAQPATEAAAPAADAAPAAKAAPTADAAPAAEAAPTAKVAASDETAPAEATAKESTTEESKASDE